MTESLIERFFWEEGDLKISPPEPTPPAPPMPGEIKNLSPDDLHRIAQTLKPPRKESG